MTESHSHSDYAADTGEVCENCGEKEQVCAFCNEPLHICAQKIVDPNDPRIPKRFRVLKDFPDYMIDRYAAVRHIGTGRMCTLVRINPESNHAMITLVRDGKKHTKSAQVLRDEAFAEEIASKECKTCYHKEDDHWMEADRRICLRPGCKCDNFNRYGRPRPKPDGQV